MEKLKRELKALELELEDMQKVWASEVKELSEKPRFDLNSKKTDKAFTKIAERYAKQMNDNLDAQKIITDELSRLAEIERKNLYKD